MLADIHVGVFDIITKIVMYIAVILTVISLVDYIWKNKGVLADR
jgi:CDP-diacylglycerol--glycerol-3-phosphate 3-phosphatidyltransferase